MKSLLPHCLLPILFGVSNLCSGQNCNVLQYAFNVTETNESLDATNSVFNYLQSDKFQEYMSKSGGGISLGFEGFSIGGNSSSEDYNKFRDYLQSENSSQFKEKVVKQVLQKVANPEAYRAWIECMNGIGIHFRYEQVGDTYNVSIIYYAYPGTPTLGVQQLTIQNATYTPLPSGIQLQSVPVEVLLTPNKKEEDILITLVANGNSPGTTFSKTFTIPGIKPLKLDTTPSLRVQCLDRRIPEACHSLSLELVSKFYQRINGIQPTSPLMGVDKATLQIDLDKLERFYENCVFSIRSGQPIDKALLESLEYDFKVTLAKFGMTP